MRGGFGGIREHLDRVLRPPYLNAYPSQNGPPRGHSPSLPARPSIAARAVSSDVWPYTWSLRPRGRGGHLLRRVQPGASVYAGNSDTSCGFAISTAEAYHAYGNGSHPFSAYSPATGLTYTMICTNAVSVCHGGNNALVYLR